MKLLSSRSPRWPLLAAALTLGLPVSAAETEDVIDYRQRVMGAQAGHMGALALLVFGKIDRPGDIAYHAEALAASLQDVASLFPEGSDFGETEALPAVWEKRADFEKVSADAKAAADELLRAVGSGDRAAMGNAFKGVGGQCKACHDDFRED